MQMHALLEAALIQTATQGDGKVKAWGKSVNQQSVWPGKELTANQATVTWHWR